MRGCRLILAYIVATPFLVAGIALLVFPGTIPFGIVLLFFAGVIAAWGWLPFIATGKQLVDRQQTKYVQAKDAQEDKYNKCQDLLE